MSMKKNTEQIKAVVALESAKKLAEAGYDQNQFPQMCWRADVQGQLVAIIREEGYSLWLCTGTPHMKWYAAPTHLQALMWLEQKKGYHWSRNFITGKYAFIAPFMSGPSRGRYPDADAFILAILEHIKAQKEDTNESQ